MTNRTRFERWAKRNLLPLDRIAEVTRNGPRWFYTYHETATAWIAWEASRRVRR